MWVQAMWIRLVSLFTSTLVMTMLVGMLLKQVGLFFFSLKGACWSSNSLVFIECRQVFA